MSDKRIDQWHMIDAKTNERYVVDVRMRWRNDGFEFYCSAPPIIHEVANGDLNHLHRAVKDAFDVGKKPWVPKILVSTMRDFSSMSDKDRCGGLRVQYRLIETTETFDGKAQWRDQDSSFVHTGKPDHDDYNSRNVLIDDTPDNRARLDVIVKALTALGSRVADLLSKKKIKTTLAQHKNLLAPPPETPP